MNIHFGDLPAWFAAIGTIGALFTALYQINNERLRRIAQESHDRIERHHAQARLVAAWGDKQNAENFIHMINSSTEPIYALVVSLVYIDERGPNTSEAFLTVIFNSR